MSVCPVLHCLACSSSLTCESTFLLLHGRVSDQFPRPFVIFRINHQVSFRASGILRAILDDKFRRRPAGQRSLLGRDGPVFGSFGGEGGTEIRKSHERVL
jgi:hypothetical protein